MMAKYAVFKMKGGHEVKKIIRSPDDLFKVGWDEDKVRETGLYLDI